MSTAATRTPASNAGSGRRPLPPGVNFEITGNTNGTFTANFRTAQVIFDGLRQMIGAAGAQASPAAMSPPTPTTMNRPKRHVSAAARANMKAAQLRRQAQLKKGKVRAAGAAE